MDQWIMNHENIHSEYSSLSYAVKWRTAQHLNVEFGFSFSCWILHGICLFAFIHYVLWRSGDVRKRFFLWIPFSLFYPRVNVINLIDLSTWSENACERPNVEYSIPLFEWPFQQYYCTFNCSCVNRRVYHLGDHKTSTSHALQKKPLLNTTG